MKTIITTLAVFVVAVMAVLAAPARAADDDGGSGSDGTPATPAAPRVGTTLATITDAENLSSHRAYVGSDGVRLACGNRQNANQATAETIAVAGVSDWTGSYWQKKLRLACPVAVPHAEGRVIASLADSDTTTADTTLQHQAVIRVVVELSCVSGTEAEVGSGDDVSTITSYSLSLADTDYYVAGTDWQAELVAECEAQSVPAVPEQPPATTTTSTTTTTAAPSPSPAKTSLPASQNSFRLIAGSDAYPHLTIHYHNLGRIHFRCYDWRDYSGRTSGTTGTLHTSPAYLEDLTAEILALCQPR